MREEHNIKDHHKKDRNSKDPITVTHVHPAVTVLILLSINHIRKDHKNGSNPSNHQEQLNPASVKHECVDQHKVEVSSLTQHPEVGSESAIGGDNMEDSAPDNIA